jgi:predicted nucleic acid-binding protein
MLRLVDKDDPQYTTVRGAVRVLIARGEGLFLSTQNFAEYCNVATRPIKNNGLGLPPQEAIALFERDIESICGTIAEVSAVYLELKRLITQYAITGKQVHDARLVAMMVTWQIENILTLNDRHFRRFEPEGIVVVTPASLIDSET